MDAPLQGYYVKEGGNVCSIATPLPAGQHFSFHAKAAFNEVWIVDTKFGEILEEYILWPSLTALTAAGINTASFCEHSYAQ